ncbi:glutathione synthetase [Sinorhizobium glycinis]|uniref:Glutathione synthetase n=1 Tax=Sinorhizobium glycinis TaxID=1472378 RepID=A0A178XXU3_9HYPH|nr:glutathione synthase [Sinorhizobium glycinis]OAP39954.1 glutathione synthetase [Sinorhizobium glycinis]
MRIAFLVNSIEGEATFYTTTSLALAALSRGHEVCYVTPGDFVLRPDDSLLIRATTLKGPKPKKPETLLNSLKGDQAKITGMDISEVQVLFLRNDPAEDADRRPWAVYVGTNFGRLAAARGVIVVNDPDGLALAQNKLYFQGFPEIVRPTTMISRSIEEIRSFIEDHPDGVILKPLQGSGGKNVFKIQSKDEANLNQIFEAASETGYLIAQSYLPEAVGGDIRLFLMNGRTLERDGVYAAFRRVPAKGDVRSNLHASGTAEPATVTPEILAIADKLRPKLIEDGMFLVGLDIVGDRILEANVFTPGGFPEIAAIHGVDFSEDVIAALEDKVRLQELYQGALPNRTLATL